MNRQSRQAAGGGAARQGITGVKVFSATMFADREKLGQRVSDWLAEQRQIEVLDMVVTQSSDASFHCVAITVFYRDQ
jgi:hypothetical protein